MGMGMGNVEWLKIHKEQSRLEYTMLLNPRRLNLIV